MVNIPDGAKTVESEGGDLRLAIISAAESLGVEPKMVQYKLDLEHFRSKAGSSVGKATVRIIGWAGEDEGNAELFSEAPPKAPRRKREDPSPAPSAETAGLEETEASKIAQAWFQELTGLMGLTGTVAAVGSDDRIVLTVEVDRAGRLIGKRGATLDAVRHLLRQVLREHGDFTIDVEIPDKRESRRGRDDDRRGRDRDRDRDRDRGDRRRGRGRRRDEGGGDRIDPDKLRALARRAADKARETQKTITVKLPLNSHDRRIVHLEVAEIDGVQSRSQVRDGKKYVQVLPDDAE